MPNNTWFNLPEENRPGQRITRPQDLAAFLFDDRFASQDGRMQQGSQGDPVELPPPHDLQRIAAILAARKSRELQPILGDPSANGGGMEGMYRAAEGNTAMPSQASPQRAALLSALQRALLGR